MSLSQESQKWGWWQWPQQYVASGLPVKEFVELIYDCPFCVFCSLSPSAGLLFSLIFSWGFFLSPPFLMPPSNSSPESVCVWHNILFKIRDAWSYHVYLKVRKRHTEFSIFETGQLFICDPFSLRKSTPTSHTVPEERQSTCRIFKLTGHLYAGQKLSPSLCQVLQSAMSFFHTWNYINNALRRAKRWQGHLPKNHRVAMELMSVADSYAALECLNMLLQEAHQIIYGACHSAQIVNRFSIEPRQNKSQSRLKYVGQTAWIGNQFLGEAGISLNKLIRAPDGKAWDIEAPCAALLSSAECMASHKWCCGEFDKPARVYSLFSPSMIRHFPKWDKSCQNWCH